MNITKCYGYSFRKILIVCLVALGISCSQAQDMQTPESPADLETLRSRLVLESQDMEGDQGKISRGTFRVFENRDTLEGRMIELDIVVLHATNPDPRPDPIFRLAGGPGQAATEMWQGMVRWPQRGERDLVLVNQRGTGGDNLLAVQVGSDEDLQGYIDPTFRTEPFRAALEELKTQYDLTQYSTPLAMDDLNEIRIALGYEQINLMGGSYGTRAALVYMRRHPETVRSAVLNGVVPLAFRNPLYHAYGAQWALDQVITECEVDPDCSKTFPDIRKELEAVLDRLDQEPASAKVAHPITSEIFPASVPRASFIETLRGMLYSTRRSRFVPLFIHQAFSGDFNPIATEGLGRSRALSRSLALAMLQCVICAEDIARIDPQEIEKETKNTYFGDFRVRGQMAICDFWPQSRLPDNYGDPVSVNVPVLLLSGTLDAVTPPRWGEEAASHLPNSLHVVAPGAHGVGGECIAGIINTFLNTGSVDGIDTSCVQDMRLPPFKLK
jgi:pimeloyl-ACP methyl ester carboxylesterase